MFKKLKQWLGITEKPEVNSKIDEIKVPKKQSHISVVDCDDPHMEAILNAVWNSGKACVGRVDENGDLKITEIEDENR